MHLICFESGNREYCLQHAYALGAMADKLVEGARVLDVGSGSGYLTVCMAILVGATGKAVGIDHIPALVDLSKKNARKSYSKLLDSGQLEFVGGCWTISVRAVTNFS